MKERLRVGSRWAEPAVKEEKEADDGPDDEPVMLAIPAEPKVKNPLDDPPKSCFHLEDRKRACSDKDTSGDGGSLV